MRRKRQVICCINSSNRWVHSPLLELSMIEEIEWNCALAVNVNRPIRSIEMNSTPLWKIVHAIGTFSCGITLDIWNFGTYTPDFPEKMFKILEDIICKLYLSFTCCSKTKFSVQSSEVWVLKNKNIATCVFTKVTKSVWISFYLLHYSLWHEPQVGFKSRFWLHCHFSSLYLWFLATFQNLKSATGGDLISVA